MADLLTAAEERRLSIAVAAGDVDARRRLIEANFGLAYGIASDYRQPGVDPDDLRSEAVLALIRAVDGFDPRRGTRFSTFAVPVIHRHIWDVFKSFRRKNRVHLRLDGDGQLAELLVVDPCRSAHDVAADRDAIGVVRRLVSSREWAVLCERSGLDGAGGQTLEQIGDRLGVTRARVRRIEKRATKRIRAVFAGE